MSEIPLVEAAAAEPMVRRASVPIYDSARRAPRAVEELTEAWRYRDLVVQLVRRDIVSRYKRSVLGVAWTMLNPLGTTVVMTIVFSRVFGRTEAYPAYVLSGLVAWHFYAQTTVAAMRELVWGSALLHRIYIPKSVFALAALGTGTVNLLLSLVPVVVVGVLTGVRFGPSLLFVPISFLLLTAFTLGVSLLLSTVAAYFADVAEMYNIALLAWMYLTPIIYPEDIISSSFRWWLFNLNPMYHLVKLFRQPLYYGQWPSPARLASAMGISLIALAIGWIAFARKADDFAYRV